MAAGCRDETIGLWDVVTGKLIRRLVGHGLTRVNAFAADGKTITSLSADGTLTVWGVATGKEVRRIRLEDWGSSHGFAVLPDQKLIAARSPGESLTIWEATTGKQIRRIQLEPWKSQLFCIAFSPDGKTLAFVSVDDTIHNEARSSSSGTSLRGRRNFPTWPIKGRSSRSPSHPTTNDYRLRTAEIAPSGSGMWPRANRSDESLTALSESGMCP